MSNLVTDDNIDDFMPAVAFICLILFISLGLYLNSSIVAHGANGEIHEAARDLLAAFLGLTGEPILALIQLSNLGTVFYAVWFYFRAGGPITAFIAGTLAFGVLFLRYVEGHHAKTGIGTESHFFVMIEYVVAIMLTLFFAVVDYASSKKEEDLARAAKLRFSSLYISIPTIISLAITMLVHYHLLLTYKDLVLKASTAFVAGVGTIVMFLSNLVFALVFLPKYAPNLKFIVDKGISNAKKVSVP